MTDWGQYLQAMRLQAPLVQNITNFVAMNIAANVLLAAGASPAMVHAPEEADEFIAIASSLTINIGTCDSAWADAMLVAARAAKAIGKPWVLDPVAIGATSFRRTLCIKLLAANPTIIRGNASEILALAGVGGASKGVDATDGVNEAESAATQLAKQQNAIVAVTGPVDFVTDGNSAWRIEGGHALMPRITALGCSLTALIGAYLAVADPAEATLAALLHYAVAGEIAGEQAQGPGSFQVAFLDALYSLTPDQLNAKARVSIA